MLVSGESESESKSESGTVINIKSEAVINVKSHLLIKGESIQNCPKLG